MATERQIAANRRNAQKSTGPKTLAGKARSRRNALKHGLAGQGIVLSAPDQKRVTRRLESFREKLAPVDELEEYLVTRIAMASVRAERAVERETSQVRRRTRRVARRWDQKQEQQIKRFARLLETEPAAAVQGLRQSAGGCEWLARAWRGLGKALKDQGHWTHAQAAQAIRLLGKTPEVCGCTGGRVGQLRLNFLAAAPEVDPEEAEAILGLNPTGLDEAARLEAIAGRLPEPEQARQVLRAIVCGQVRKLDRLALRRWQRSDGPDRAEELAIAQVDTTLEGVRLQRYESCHEMGVHRNLNELIKIRRQEPELASIARWEKQGKKYSRRWDGYCWVPNAEWRLEDASEAGSGEEPRTMTDARWLMTEQRADSGSDLVRHPSSVMSHSPSAPVRHQPSAIRHSPSAPVSHQPSAIRHPGSSPAVWPGLSGACPGLLPKDPRLEEASGLESEGPVTASGGSLCSTPGTPSGGDRDEGESGLRANEHVRVAGASPGGFAPATLSGAPGDEAGVGLAGEESASVSGSSLCSDPGTRSDGDLEGREEPWLAGDTPLAASGASADAVAPATLSAAARKNAEPGPQAAEPLMLSGSSLCSDPGTRSDGGAGSWGLGAGEEKAMTDDKRLMTEQRPDPVSHQPSVLSHPAPQSLTPDPQPLPVKAHLPADPPHPLPHHDLQTGCPGSSGASPRLLPQSLEPADPWLPRAALPPNEPDSGDARSGGRPGWNPPGAGGRSGFDGYVNRQAQPWPHSPVFDPVW